MDPKPMGQFLTDLPEERIAKYRLLAAHAHESARTAKSPEVKTAYMTMAVAWETLISEYERALDGMRSHTSPEPRPDHQPL